MTDRIFNKKNNRAIICAVYAICILFTLTFIFGNSYADVETSKEQSGNVVELIKDVIGSALNVSDEELTYIVRKTAHFVEYCALGFEFALLAFHLSYGFKLRDGIYAAAASLLVADLDELLQFYRGRGSMVSDVFLDLSGALTGIAVGYALSYLVRMLYRKKKAKAESQIKLSA